MPKITVLPHTEICPNGKIIKDAPEGLSICKILLANNIAIEHACELVCACTTCHIIVKEGYDSLNDIDDMEEDMLDKAWGLSHNSRLSCQSILGSVDLVIEIPKYTINHAKE
ncbi:ferredoxin, 2Fe-2S [Candidatus Kinetoplastibacterium desouzaii TCC079E]|uniref:2Fe-2S ferredoxin n=1 Tax=Candidatus Kinetoplastidibacterium desouzai TCC079E TaxID=1208919 RepID=M1M3I9_9PROT|nr:ISC system 2Fe-2S type ferredoxin [Candidatus Kinetoplastibacterium desouzaii]AGF46810.1 ferredoxin, 2Fe-2S [Candidatus Kinetoplastibacterium desouzaii TCC079E]